MPDEQINPTGPINPTEPINSTEPINPTRAISPWWALLLLPAALSVGWFVGVMPSAGPRAQKAGESQVATTTGTPATPATPASSSHPFGASGSPESGTPLSQPDLVPASEPRPSEEAPPAVVSQWTSLQGAMAESGDNGKPVMIDFNADWCGPCQRMKQQLFDDGARGQAVQAAVIPVSIVDRRREEGRNPPEIESLQQRFNVNAFPTLIVFSPQSGKIMRTEGFGGADATLAWITDAARAVR